MKEIQGDLISLAQRGKFDLIAHGCNCFCSMGAGLAKSIRETFPEAYYADRLTNKGDRAKLGLCSYAHYERGNPRYVVNAYTQYHWDGDGKEVLADYDAIRSCMRFIREEFSGLRTGFPLIGAGLARGDWNTIRAIIAEELAHEDVTIVHYERA